MGILIQTEHPRSSPNDDQKKEKKFLAIKPMVNDGTISSLEGIVKYIGKYKIARKIGIKGSTLDRYLKKLGIFPIGEIRSIGELFDLDLSEMLKLIAVHP
jgi:abortive infection bacteriophage resistance protein